MAQPAPEIRLEPSSATVGVRIIDTTSWISLPTKHFFGPPIKGFDELSVPSYSFLIEHPSGRKLLFDLGIRKDWENLSPAIIGSMQHLGPAKIDVKKGVREQLEEHGVSGSSIEGIIWSHWHFDHSGDPSTFDAHTALIVGPGFKDAFVPGYPTNQDSTILESDYAGRERKWHGCEQFWEHGLSDQDYSWKSLTPRSWYMIADTFIVREIQFDPEKRIGRFEAFDYFGDGSYFILNAPGHAIGHVCALARVTSNPDSYILMGGDAAHQAGQFRPSIYLPLPDAIVPHPLDIHSANPCPGALFEHLLQGGDRTRPFSDVATDGVSLDADEAQRTIGKLQEADAHDNILVVIAHEKSILKWVDFFPKYANEFLSKDWDRKSRWTFLKDYKEALE